MTNQTESMPVNAAIDVDPCGAISAEDCCALEMEAERELAAFLTTIRSTFGPEATGRAAREWVEVFEATPRRFDGTPAPFRNVTIRAANRVAQGGVPIHAGDIQH